MGIFGNMKIYGGERRSYGGAGRSSPSGTIDQENLQPISWIFMDKFTVKSTNSGILPLL